MIINKSLKKRIVFSNYNLATDNMGDIFQSKTPLPVMTVNDKDPVQPGHICFAPPNYRLLIEQQETFSLSIDEKVNNSRPSIDVLFESAVSVWRDRLIYSYINFNPLFKRPLNKHFGFFLCRSLYFSNKNPVDCFIDRKLCLFTFYYRVFGQFIFHFYQQLIIVSFFFRYKF
ncbi:MAG: hypothetical protein KKE44_18095 [Proteobacteria bacterium]|nr:hypothetical protein [Pseudomonadota bacterium]MBU1584644.1 hypothetical protein [Pseudomonadota bacterium]MBU2452503.1 hypothetical protein [Pseudomonadota bacterium]MBU2629545.1 hypothetical protein [Pseudomonadota bacterium]